VAISHSGVFTKKDKNMNVNMVNENANPNRLQRFINGAGSCMKKICTTRPCLLRAGCLVLGCGVGALGYFASHALGLSAGVSGIIAGASGGTVAVLTPILLLSQCVKPPEPLTADEKARAESEGFETRVLLRQNLLSGRWKKLVTFGRSAHLVPVDEALKCFEHGKMMGKLELQSEMIARKIQSFPGLNMAENDNPMANPLPLHRFSFFANTDASEGTDNQVLIRPEICDVDFNDGLEMPLLTELPT
jgi:hypothetical protein